MRSVGARQNIHNELRREVIVGRFLGDRLCTSIDHWARLYNQCARRDEDLLTLLIFQGGSVADEAQVRLALRHSALENLNTALQSISSANRSRPVGPPVFGSSYPQILVMRDFRRRFGFHL